jgi:hypothetical protein
MMKSARRTLGLLAVALLGATWLASAAQAKTIKVDANGTTEAIQSAINAAGAYDTVAVPAGTYAGRKEQPHQRRAGHRAGEHGQLRRAPQHADQQHDGIFVIVLPNLPKATTEKALIEENSVHSNNRPNPFPPVCQEPESPPGCVEDFYDDLQLLPSGSGRVATTSRSATTA